METLTSQVRACAHGAGFDVVGIAPAQRAPLARLLRAWLDRGMHGTMHYMEDPDGRLEVLLWGAAEPRRRMLRILIEA